MAGTQRKTVRVAVTGAAGQIGYSLLFRIANGEAFGPDTDVILHLVEIPQAMKAVEGVMMELGDCAFSHLVGVKSFDQPSLGFEGVNWALLVGAAPRGAGMTRGDLLRRNASIFVDQGKALLRGAQDIRCVVVGNPCNTNALIARSHSQDIPYSRYFAMTTLDENRAKNQIMQKAEVRPGDVQNLTIWGNHSASMVPDYENAQIGGRPLSEVITDLDWLRGEFFTRVQKRGEAIINARGKSSAASAASSCVDLLQNLTRPTPLGGSFSVGIYTESNPYNLGSGVVYSFPVRTLNAEGSYEIAPQWQHTSYLHEKLVATEKELLKEKADIADLI